MAIYLQQWGEALLIACLLVIYLAVLRITRCRVETVHHRPCKWRVRGILGTCDYHVGYKRSIPRLVRGLGFVGLPTFMWPRDDFAGMVTRTEHEPMPGRAVTPKANRARYDWGMMALAGVGVIAAVVGVARDFVAG